MNNAWHRQPVILLHRSIAPGAQGQEFVLEDAGSCKVSCLKILFMESCEERFRQAVNWGFMWDMAGTATE